MDEMEEFREVFFEECDELLTDLQDHLAKILDGDRDPETLNAAFRAVHSVKGGAGAFGFDKLIAFTHVFETCMDAVRNGDIETTTALANVLLRAGDVMAKLIEHARYGGSAPTETAASVQADLEAYTAGEAPSVHAEAASSAPAEDDPAAPAEAEEQVEASEPEQAEEEPEETRTVTVNLRPGEDFFGAGHDPLRVMRAARSLGLTGVKAHGEVPLLSDIDVNVCPLWWEMTFETSEPLDEFEMFFTVYEHIADVTIVDASDADDAGEAEDDTAEVVAQDQPQDLSAETVEDAVAAAEDLPAAAVAPVLVADEVAVIPEDVAPIETAGSPIQTPREIEQAARAAQPASGGGTDEPIVKAGRSLRVELSRVDRLVNMVGEIVITQAVLTQSLSQSHLGTSAEAIHAIQSLSRQTRELQESVMAIRAQPVKSVFARMPRIVRDLAASLNKEAKMILVGEHTEVDTTVIEELAEPLTHMVRNSMDHGLEMPDVREANGKPRSGTIVLGAEHRGERVIISITDDGAGINRERVLKKAVERGIVSADAPMSPEEIDQLIFHPGFSTAETISNVSGRGVGMDVVKKKIQALGGRVAVKNEPGKGAEFSIALPLTLAIVDGMTVRVGSERFVLPLGNVVEALEIEDGVVQGLPNGSCVLPHRGEYLPLVSLRTALGVGGSGAREKLAVIVDTETDGRVGLLIDELIGQGQVVLKSLEQNFKRIEGVSGATILGDGKVALILDIPALPGLGGGASHMVGQEMVH